MTNLQRLLSISSPPLSDATPRLAPNLESLIGSLAPQLLSLVWARNGFTALECALHVRPLSDDPAELGIVAWNSAELWKNEYRGMADDMVCFAEDLFGNQFSLTTSGVVLFTVETGEVQLLADSLEDWAARILGDDGNLLTGWSLARNWQLRHGSLSRHERLVPKIPFVAGGEFDVENLHAMNTTDAMRFYGRIAIQIRGLPDGAAIRLEVVD